MVRTIPARSFAARTFAGMTAWEERIPFRLSMRFVPVVADADVDGQLNFLYSAAKRLSASLRDRSVEHDGVAQRCRPEFRGDRALPALVRDRRFARAGLHEHAVSRAGRAAARFCAHSGGHSRGASSPLSRHGHVSGGRAGYRFRRHLSTGPAMAGVECAGPVGQSRLATEIRTAAALAYPSIYPETSCISVLEAMRCGCAILTTRLGALPETAASFGRYLDMPAHARDLVGQYAAMLVDALHAMRAAEWTAWLEKLLGIGG
ncbi:MAG: glycosyltransferase [Rudaea sp.]|uniref:glycosyltransferase n=1 Tax=Rudaea sp. TaxID=2136325 RepID=UPI0039E3B960